LGINNEATNMVLLIDDNNNRAISFLNIAKEAIIPVERIKIANAEVQVIKHLSNFSPYVIFINTAFNKNNPNSIFKVIKQEFPLVPIVFLINNKNSKADKASYFQDADDILYLPDLTPALLERCMSYTIERLNIKSHLNKTLERYLLLTKATNHIVWDWNMVEHSCYWVGNGLREILGYKKNEMLVASDFWESNIHPDERKKVTEKLNNIFLEGKINRWEDEYLFKKKDGSYINIYDRGFIIYKDGVAVRMIGSMEDISKRKAAEESLLKSEKSYRHLFNKNPLPTLIWNAENYKVIEVNERAISEYGYTKKEFLKLTVFDLQSEEDHNCFRLFANKALTSKKKTHNYTWIHKDKKNNKMLMNVTSYRIMYKDIPSVLAMAKNITAETELNKKIEIDKNLKRKQIAEAVIAAQEKERTEIGKELHDNVNQLLSASRLYIEAAKTNEKKEKELLNQASEFIMTAIEEIRVLSKALYSPPIKEIGICESIKHLAEDLMEVQKIEIVTKLSDFYETALQEGFKLAIFRIVQEQMSNIIKYAKATKAIIILKRVDNEIILEIEDNGIGFDVVKKAKGIGLKNIQSRAELYKGALVISSKKREGTSIQIKFPLSETLQTDMHEN
jgi:PAS domain S-box-containing protein